jgi:hypothetical protein
VSGDREEKCLKQHESRMNKQKTRRRSCLAAADLCLENVETPSDLSRVYDHLRLTKR